MTPTEERQRLTDSEYLLHEQRQARMAEERAIHAAPLPPIRPTLPGMSLPEWFSYLLECQERNREEDRKALAP
jgi:hypothetical protein